MKHLFMVSQNASEVLKSSLIIAFISSALVLSKNIQHHRT